MAGQTMFTPGTPEWFVMTSGGKAWPGPNLLVNGEFEIDVTGWTLNDTVAASAEQSYQGAKSAKVTNDTIVVPSSFPMYQSLTLPGAGTYQFQAAIYVPTAWSGGQIRLTDNGQYGGATDTFPQAANMGLRDQWQLLTATCTPAADFSGLFGILTTTSLGDGTSFYVDSCRVRRTA